jgi:hypothetical protein
MVVQRIEKETWEESLAQEIKGQEIPEPISPIKH